MTKANIIESITAKTGVDKASASRIVEEFMDIVKADVAAGNMVTLRGFGTFRAIVRNEKNFHYAPGKYRIIPAHREPMLKFANEVKEAVK